MFNKTSSSFYIYVQERRLARAIKLGDVDEIEAAELSIKNFRRNKNSPVGIGSEGSFIKNKMSSGKVSY